jgi:kinesin family protein 2/24
LDAYGIPIETTSSTNTLAKKKKTSMSTVPDRIRVCVRKRPLNQKEQKKGENDIVLVMNRRNLSVHETKYIPNYYDA